MATLEKIRSKQKLLFTIVIIALFLFIISIASADSIRRMFGPGTTIAQVGNQKIDYQDHRNYIEQQNQQNQQQKTDHDELSQMAVHDLLQKALLEEQYEKLGIKVTDAEITKAMTNPMLQQTANFVMQACNMLGIYPPSGESLLYAIQNPERAGIAPEMRQNIPYLRALWRQNEDLVEQTLKQSIFSMLYSGLYTYNDLDAKAMYEDNNTNYVLSYVTAPYSTIADDGIEVSDADIKAKYEQLKPQFKLQEETRMVDYIVVPIRPSQADYNAAEVEVDRLTEALMAEPGMAGAANVTGFLSDQVVLPVSDVKKNPTLASMPDSLIKTEGVYKFPLSGNTFNVAKVTNISAQVDSVNVSMFTAASVEQADSINAALAAGKTLADLSTEYPGQVMLDQWGSLVGDESNFAKILAESPVGKTDLYTDTLQGVYAVYCVNERKQPRQYAEITLMSYAVDPSSQTVSDIKSQLSSFIASNSKGDAFTANADSLYHLQHTAVTASTPKLGNNPETRHAIQWAMNAKKNVVSPIFDDDRDKYVVLVVKDIYDGGYIPYNSSQIKDFLTAQVKADKKGDQLVEKYAGKAKDLEGYATLMGAEVRTDSTVVFTKPNLATLYANEYMLQAQVAAAQPKQLVGPLKGANEVMVFVVDGSEIKRDHDKDTDGKAFMNAFGIKDVYGMLVGDRKIKNNTLKFENYER